MQELTPPAMKGITPDADTWSAVLPLADPPDILPSWVGEEDVRPAPQAPCLSLETPPDDGKGGKVRRVLDRD